jgi:hypothetical protein
MSIEDHFDWQLIRSHMVMGQQKDKAMSRSYYIRLPAPDNDCYANAVAVLQELAAATPDAWFYVEGMVSSPQETCHHAWLVCGNKLLDPTLPERDIDYMELRSWPAAHILQIVKQDLEFPLTDEAGQIRPESGYRLGE